MTNYLENQKIRVAKAYIDMIDKKHDVLTPNGNYFFVAKAKNDDYLNLFASIDAESQPNDEGDFYALIPKYLSKTGIQEQFVLKDHKYSEAQQLMKENKGSKWPQIQAV